VTCCGCGKVQSMPVRPSPGIDLYCVDCLSSKPAGGDAAR